MVLMRRTCRVLRQLLVPAAFLSADPLVSLVVGPFSCLGLEAEGLGSKKWGLPNNPLVSFTCSYVLHPFFLGGGGGSFRSPDPERYESYSLPFLNPLGSFGT